MNPKVKSFYHKETYTWTHLVSCPVSKNAIIIDPVLDYNPNNANTSTVFIDIVLSYIAKNNLKLNSVYETHAHADHLTSAHYIVSKTGCKIAIGSLITAVQSTFKNIFGLDDSFKVDGSQFHDLLIDGDVVELGSCIIEVMHTPGHTNDSMSFIIGDCVFIGDTLFSPDYGTARCDFPGGDAGKLYDSIQNIFSLGLEKKLYLCHDYPPDGREPEAYHMVKRQQGNIHLKMCTEKKTFIKMRNKRDASLNQPQLIIPSIQVNIDAGKFPDADENGKVFLKIPINTIVNQ